MGVFMEHIEDNRVNDSKREDNASICSSSGVMLSKNILQLQITSGCDGGDGVKLV